MKKLLMMGIILVLGATSFAGVEVELNSKGSTNNMYSGSGRMTVGSTGYAVEGVDTGTLIVTPTMSEGTDGTSLEFKFGDLVKGSTEVATGRFKAEIVDKNQKLATLNGKITAKLQTIDLSNGVSTITGEGDKIDKIELMKPNVGGKFGTLSYELTSKKENNAGKTYEVEVMTTVAIDSNTDFTGTFADKSARIFIDVTNGWTSAD